MSFDSLRVERDAASIAMNQNNNMGEDGNTSNEYISVNGCTTNDNSIEYEPKRSWLSY